MTLFFLLSYPPYTFASRRQLGERCCLFCRNFSPSWSGVAYSLAEYSALYTGAEAASKV